MPHNETVTQISYKILCNLDYEIDVIAFKSSEDDYFSDFVKKDKKMKKISVHYINYDWEELKLSAKNLNVFKIKKLMNLYAKESIKMAEKNNYDYVISFSVPNYTHISGYKVKRKYKDKIKWIACFSDPITNNIYIENMKKNGLKNYLFCFFLKLLQYNGKIEKNALKYSNRLIFICDELRDYVTKGKKEYLDKSIIYPITYVKEWINYKKLKAIGINNKQRKNNKLTFAHFGNIYGLRKIDKFLDAIYELKKEGEIDFSKIEIHQYGDIDRTTRLVLANHEDDNIIQVHERVDYDKCIDIMNNNDVLIIFDTISNNKIQPFLPSKIVDYLLTNKPIFAVTMKESPLYRMINDNHICVSYNIDEIKNGFKKQVLEFKQVNNNVDSYDNDVVSKQILGDYLDIIDFNKEEK